MLGKAVLPTNALASPINPLARNKRELRATPNPSPKLSRKAGPVKKKNARSWGEISAYSRYCGGGPRGTPEWLWLPAQDRFAGSRGLIQPAHTRGIGCFQDKFRVFLDFFGNGPHRFDELIEFLLTRAFCRLDHHCAGNDQRKSGRVRMEAVINQPFGNVHCADTPCGLPPVGKHALMHAGLVVGKVVNILQPA